MRRPILLRLTAGLGGAGLLAIASWGVLFVLLIGAISAQEPDPSVADGDPCCSHPDTWAEVAAGLGLTVGYALVDALLFALAIALLAWAARGRWPSRRRLALIPAGGVAAATITFAATLAADTF